ncbi:MAG: ABC transporter ATP-binding protein [Eubacteriales bacterium]|nr:ABC transporter ATP-binding protein [Eubacteriales bacterium]
MKLLLSYLKPYRKRIIVAGLIDMLSVFCALFMPYIMSGIVNRGIAEADMNYIWLMCGIMLGLAAISLGCLLVTVRLNTAISADFLSDMQKAIFRKINSFTYDEFSSIGTASLLTRQTQDLFSLEMVAYNVMHMLIYVVVMCVGGGILAFMTDWIMALITLAVCPLVLFAVWLITRGLFGMFQNSAKYIDIQNKVVRERLSGLRVIRAFNRENSEHKRVSEATVTMAEFIIRANVRSGYITPVTTFILDITAVALLGIGASRISASSVISAGGIIANIQYISLIMGGIIMLSWAFAWLPHIRVSLGRITEILAMKGADITEADIQDLTQSEIDGIVSEGAVSVDNLTFRYGLSGVPALESINFRASDGETVGIIGGTGAGKSTLVKLLLAFYTDYEGNIKLGGRDYKSLGTAAVRKNISVALQKSMVFEGTAEENIRMGYPQASETEIKEAARAAQIADFFESQPEGYNCRLAQSGANISGGQKQRINIARTLIKPAPVYIFDDTFSALDYLTESKLRRALGERLKGKTKIVITQRAATAMHCDRIYVMDNGRIVGEGTHARLLESCVVYREIYDSQIKRTFAAREVSL